MRKILMISCVTLCIAFMSCNKNVVFSEYTKIPEEGWKTENKLSYTVDITDNKPYHNVFLTVRHADSYPFSNLFVFLTTTYPDGKKSVDTLECILANKKGEWQGDGAGDLWDNKIPLKQNLMFPQTGKYTFTFEQGMRPDPLPLIMDFGMVIEKVK
ncbi:MAG: gliding motility lipoprotein GldH [Bacteroidota bacterium]